MNKNVFIGLGLALLGFIGTVQAQTAVVSKIETKVLSYETIPAAVSCKKTEAPTTNVVVGGAIGGGLGAAAGKYFFGESGKVIGGLIGAGAGGALGNIPSEECAKKPVTYEIHTKSSDGKEFFVQSEKKYEVGNTVFIYKMEDGSLKIR